MEESQPASPSQPSKIIIKQASQVALGIGSLIFVLSIIPAQQGDVGFGSILDYWLAHMNSLELVPLSLSMWHSLAIIVQAYWLFALACITVGMAFYARKAYHAAIITALLPLSGVILLTILELVGGLSYP